jgi:hypothetical protein
VVMSSERGMGAQTPGLNSTPAIVPALLEGSRQRHSPEEPACVNESTPLVRAGWADYVGELPSAEMKSSVSMLASKV